MPGFGWRPDIPDKRDIVFVAPFVVLPDKIDLRTSCPPVYDQGQLGSCTAFACTSLYEFDHMKQGLGPFHGSELFTYYETRKIEHTIPYDAGASIRDAMKSLNTAGNAPENLWPYDVTLFAKRPGQKALTAAKKDKTVRYSRVPLFAMKTTLANDTPFVIGIAVYDSFMAATDGYIPMPDLSKERVIDGHAIMIVGYDSAHYIFRNSWGESWGEKGYGFIPCEYLEDINMAADSWVIRLVE